MKYSYKTTVKCGLWLIAGFLLQLGLIQGQDTVWVKPMQGTDWEQGTAVAVDAGGNVYTTGYFRGTVDFDPGVDVFPLTSAGSEDIFITKLDSAGNLRWALQLGGAGADFAYGVTVDSSGNVYTTGAFEGTVDFDSDASIAPRTSAGMSDIFVTKHDSTGALIWASNLGGTGADVGRGVAVGVDGIVYATGRFEPTGGPADSADVFIVALTSVGQFVANFPLGSVGFDVGYGITIDGNGSIYVTGFFSRPPNGNDIFITKLSNEEDGGTWTRFLGGDGNDVGRAIAVDGAGNVYTTGSFTRGADFDPGPGVVNIVSSGGQDIFISKLDRFGEYVWAETRGAGGADVGYGIAVDTAGDVHTTGFFAGTVDFDPIPFGGLTSAERAQRLSVSEITSVGAADIFISKVDSAGTHIWARGMGGSANDIGFGAAVDNSGNLYTTGFFSSDTAHFGQPVGTQSGEHILVAAGAADVFVLKTVAEPSPGPPPTISEGGVVLATLLPTVNSISPRSIISVFGQNFSTSTTLFADLDGDGNIARILGGTCLEMNGVRLPIFTMTPGQINAQASASQVFGPASFQVITNCDTANALLSERGTITPRSLDSDVETATVETATPGFFLFPPLADDGLIAARFNADAIAVAPAGMFNDQFGPSRPAQPGDIVVLFGTGWGPTTASLGTGQLATGAAQLLPVANPTVSFGGIFLAQDDVFYVGVTPNTAGLYQLAIRVPAVAIAGNYPVVLTVYGKSTPVGPVIPVELP